MKKIGAGFWLFSSESLNLNKDKILIDLSEEKSNHFGDQLFFISAFLNKNTDRFIFLTNKKYLMLWRTFGFQNVFDSISDLEFDKFIYVSSYETSFLNKKFSTNFTRKVFFDFTDTTIVDPLSQHISNIFGLIQTETKSFKFDEKNNSYTNDKYYIFNDIMYSRGFLRNKLSKKLKQYIENEIGYKNNIYFVGSLSDKEFFNFNPRLIDIRGEISFEELLNLFMHKNCLGYIGLDNGLMHLSLLLDLKCKILFRGKFSKSQTDLHHRSINIAMNDNAKNNIEYVKNKKVNFF